jgi:hypothetical protein
MMMLTRAHQALVETAAIWYDGWMDMDRETPPDLEVEGWLSDDACLILARRR